MDESLRPEYEKYLADHGLRPRALPSQEEREQAELQISELMYDEARSRDDPMAESIRAAFEERQARSDDPNEKHPATVKIEEAAADVEATIHSVPAFRERFRDNVFVGEYPTGSFHTQTVKIDRGFLILVNSGMSIMPEQIANFLVRGDPDNPESEKTRRAADGVAAVLTAYVDLGDSFYGPKPVNGGFMHSLGTFLSGSAGKFVIAHEYAHVLQDHFGGNHPGPVDVDTPYGQFTVSKRSQVEELEADDLGYRLTLGVERYDQFDFGPVDAPFESDDLGVLREGMRQKCLLAGPSVALLIDMLLEHLAEPAYMLDSESKWSGTHPPSLIRMLNLSNAKRFPMATTMQLGYKNYALMMLRWADYIAERVKQKDFLPTE